MHNSGTAIMILRFMAASRFREAHLRAQSSSWLSGWSSSKVPSMVPSKCRQSIVKVSLKIVPESGLGEERAGLAWSCGSTRSRDSALCFSAKISPVAIFDSANRAVHRLRRICS